MSKNDVLSKFPAHRLEGAALRFSAHEVRVGTELRTLRAGSQRQNSPAFWLWQKGELKVRQLRKVRQCAAEAEQLTG
jgi:hypothetical protein